MHFFRPIVAAALATVAAAAGAAPAPDELASSSLDTEIKLVSDLRTRGIADSLNKPAVKASLQFAHESGLIGLLEVSSVSRKQFLDGDGLGVTAAAGWRFGDPEAWHFGVGLATEFFPGAKFDAPHGFDPDAGPTDFRRTRYDSTFAVLEYGYGALDGRVLNVISKTYRGADTGGVCGAMLALMPDPTKALECYARGDHNSRGSWLADLDYKFQIEPATTLTLHAGYQRIRNFREADFSDIAIGVTHKRWGFEWGVNAVSTNTRVRELYLAQDGNTLRATDGSKVVLSVSRKL